MHFKKEVSNFYAYWILIIRYKETLLKLGDTKVLVFKFLLKYTTKYFSLKNFKSINLTKKTFIK